MSSQPPSRPSGPLRNYQIGGRLAISSFQRAFKMIDGSIKVERVTTPAQLEDTKRLRREIYGVEKQFLGPDELLDEYDARAIVFNAYENGVPIGTTRVTDSADGKLEIFAMHPELEAEVRPGARYLEVSRLMVRKQHRGLHATMPLFREVYRQLAETGADGLILSGAGKLVNYYRRLMGFRTLSTQPLAHKKLKGLTDYAMIFEVPESFANPTALRMAVWFSIHPSCFWQGMGIQLKNALGEGSE